MKSKPEIEQILEEEKKHHEALSSAPEATNTELGIIQGWIEALAWVLESKPTTEGERQLQFPFMENLDEKKGK